MIITACVIPILVFVIFIWGTKMILGLDYNMPGFSDINKAMPKMNLFKNKEEKAKKEKKNKKE